MRYVSFGRGKTRETSRTANTENLETDDINNIVEIYRAIKNLNSQLRKDVDLALRRLRFSADRVNLEDHLIDCVFGMESLLGTDNQGEISFKFQMRGASILPDSFGSPQTRRDLLRNMYTARSKLAHGKTLDATEYSEDAERALLEILKWFITRGQTLGTDVSSILMQIDRRMIEGCSRYISRLED